MTKNSDLERTIDELGNTLATKNVELGNATNEIIQLQEIIRKNDATILQEQEKINIQAQLITTLDNLIATRNKEIEELKIKLGKLEADLCNWNSEAAQKQHNKFIGNVTEDSGVKNNITINEVNTCQRKFKSRDNEQKMSYEVNDELISDVQKYK